MTADQGISHHTQLDSQFVTELSVTAGWYLLLSAFLKETIQRDYPVPVIPVDPDRE